MSITRIEREEKMKANAQGMALSNWNQPGEIGTLRMGRKQGTLFLGLVIFCHNLASSLQRN